MSVDAATLLLEQFEHLLTTPGAVAELNRAILTLAVHGRLVEQDSRDEPASVLLKRIDESRDQKDHERTLVIASRDEKSFNLPNGWIWAELNMIAVILMGQSPPGNSYNAAGEGIPLINGPVEFNPNPFGSTKKTKFTTLPTVMCREGDLLVCVRGSTTGRTNIAGFEACIGRGVAAIRSKYDYQEYINYLMLYHRDKLYSLGTGSTFPSVSSDKIHELIIAFPPLAEQKRIVSRVEALFTQTSQLANELTSAQHDLALLNQSALAHLLAAETPEDFAAQWDFITQHFDCLFTESKHIAPLRQAILELAVRGKLTRRDPADEPAGELLARIKAEKAKLGKGEPLPPVKESEKPLALPKGWTCTKLGSVISLEYGDGLPKTKRADEGEIPVYGSNGIVGYHTEFLVDEPCIVVGRKGSSGAINLSLERSWVIDTAYYVVPPEYLDIRFLSFVLRDLHLESLGKGIKPGLNRKEVYELIIGIPPLAEQGRIVAKVEQLLSLCDALETKLRTARESRIRLTAAVLAGIGGSIAQAKVT